MTRATEAAGALTIWAIRVAGVAIMPTSLARSSLSDGSAARAFTPSALSEVAAHRATENDEFVIPLGEIGRNLRRCNRIIRISDQRLSLEQIDDAFGASTLKSDLGETVLRDFDGAAGLTHLRTKIVHLRDGDTGIVGHDH
jgi:hypothetical protein